MEEKKSSTTKYIIYAVVFVVSFIGFFVISQVGEQDINTVSGRSASLPIVMMKTKEGQLYNRLHGYTKDIKEELLNTELTLIPQDYKMDIVVDTYGEKVEAISYKVRSKSDMSLIENTKVDNFETDDERISAVLDIKNLIRDGQEYILEVVIKTDKYDEISYYTTIVKDAGVKLTEKLQYVLNFSQCTINPDRLSEITGNLETSKDADNSNYGKVDITNSKELVGWGNLKPVIESNVVPSLYMVDSEVAIVTLDYTVGIANGTKGYDTIRVHEFYRIRQTTQKFYLLNYDRQSTQLFDGKMDLISSGKINLGMNPDDEDIELKSDAKNRYIYFVNEGNLWCFDNEEHKYTRVFSFEAGDSDNVRERIDEHAISIINVSEEGNSYFMVYGYMNSGMHEGEVGVSLLRYDYNDNTIKEELYIPVEVPAFVLCNNIGDMVYVTEQENSLHVKIGEVLYQADLYSKSVVAEVTGLAAGTFCISDSRSILAYATDGKSEGSKRVRVYNVAEKTDHYIDASEGQVVRALGFIGDDFIYGIANETDIIIDSDGKVTYAMNKLFVIDQEYNEIRSYEVPGYYITDTSLEEHRINLYRVKKNDAGEFVSASLDQLINKNENQEEDKAYIDVIVTDGRKTEVVIVLIGEFKGGTTAFIRYPSRIEYEENAQVEIKEDIKGTGKYYVCGYGNVISDCQDIVTAVSNAWKQYGSVYDSEHNLVWKRFKSSSRTLADVKTPGCSKDRSYDTAKSIVSGYSSEKNTIWLKLDNISVEYVLPFVDLGSPVMAATSDGYVIITGYTSKELTYLNTMNGQSVTVTISDGIKLFAQAGNMFETYYGK